jgi:hypothetical protein
MLKVSLLEKAYNSYPPSSFSPLLSSICHGLNVKLEIIGKSIRDWIQIEISGKDELAARYLLDKEIGLAPNTPERLEKYSIVRGKIYSPNEKEKAIRVDIGISSPENCDASIPIQRLQAQLADGRRFPIQKLIRLFCMYKNCPLEVKILHNKFSDATKTRTLQAEISAKQLLQFWDWIRHSLDRLVVLGANLPDITYAVKKSGHSRDIIRVEPLGFLEHVILCKLGTESKGLIPEIGHYLPEAMLIPFSPKMIRKALGTDIFS